LGFYQERKKEKKGLRKEEQRRTRESIKTKGMRVVA
jgi:hypothetical protein